jgi:predicted ATPase
MLGYPDAAIADIDHALKYGREIEQAATLMYALNHAVLTDFWTGNYAAAATHIEELISLSNEKGAPLWNALGKMNHGCAFILTGKASSAIQTFTSGIAALQSTGSAVWMPMYLPYLATAYAKLHQFDEAWCSISEAMTAMENTKEILWQAEVHRTAGEIALMASEPDPTQAEAYFKHALDIARQQQAKSWELRAAMSMARLWRDQGKRVEDRELLAPVYGWFTEGFDTLDLKEAKALLEELGA